MNLHITKEEFAQAYADNYEGATLSDIELENAVNDYNGRVDNFLDFLFEEVLEGARAGDFASRCCDHDYESGCPCCGNECDKCYKEEGGE